MIHNHEVRSSILRPATKLEALAFFASAFFVFVLPRGNIYAELYTSLFWLNVKSSWPAEGSGLKLLVSPIHVLKLIFDSHWGMFDFLDRLPWKNLELRLSSGQRHIDFCNSLIYKEL